MRCFALIAALILSSSALAVPIEPRESGDEKWATVRGQVVFGGDKVPEFIATNAKARGGPPFIETWVVHPKSKGVKNVFVWLAIDPKDRGIRMPQEKIHPDLRKLPAAVPEIDVRGLQFFPTAIAMRGGQSLQFKNSSNEATNFNYRANTTNGNVVVPAKKSYEVAQVPAESVPIYVQSNVHPWMRGYVRVFDHPYFAVTDDDGRFEIRLAPVGKMRVWLWHPESGFRDGAKGRDGDAIEVKPRGTDLGTIKIQPIK